MIPTDADGIENGFSEMEDAVLQIDNTLDNVNDELSSKTFLTEEYEATEKELVKIRYSLKNIMEKINDCIQRIQNRYVENEGRCQ